MDNYTDYNAEVIDKWTEGGWEWGVPISHEAYRAAMKGEWDVFLTPTKKVPHDWFKPFLINERLEGVCLLGLACGGGQQMPIFQALGADCTVMDYSEKMLDMERLVSEREGYSINIVRADMSKPLPFADGSFDMIFHPVSNVYVEDIQPIWKECYRILKPGGILMAGCDNGINFLIENDTEPLKIEYVLPFNPLRNPEHRKLIEGLGDAYQFSHTYAEQIGGQLKAGFRLTNLFDDTNNAGALCKYNVPTFVATLSIKEQGEYMCGLARNGVSTVETDVQAIEIAKSKSKICEIILRALPEWFGNLSAIDEFAGRAANEPFWAVFDNDTPIAFIALTEHNAHTCEIDVMGVLNAYQRNGIGKRLIGTACDHARRSGRKYLLVKTLDYSSTYEPYARTRAFYEAMGFVPLQTLKDYWDKNNPCLLMCKSISV